MSTIIEVKKIYLENSNEYKIINNLEIKWEEKLTFAEVIKEEENFYKVKYRGRYYSWTINKEIGDLLVCGPCQYGDQGKSPQDFPWVYAITKNNIKWHIYHTTNKGAMIEIDMPDVYAQEINPYWGKKEEKWIVDL